MYSFTVQRINDRRSSPEKIKTQLEKMVVAALRGTRGTVQGWALSGSLVPPEPKPLPNGSYQYNFTFKFEKNSRRATSPEVTAEQFEVLKRMALQAGNVHKWEEATIAPSISTSRVQIQEPKEPRVIAQSLPKFEVKNSEFNLNPAGFFDHLYDRAPQIDVLLSSVRTAVETDFKERAHCLIEGDPAGGKTTLALCFQEMMGPERCYYINAPTATQAGMLGDLLERMPLPNFLIIDEVEKVDPKHFGWLLAVMDERAELSVNNSRTGLIRMKLPAYVIGIVNDSAKLEFALSGALSSRFGDRIYCPQVTRWAIYNRIRDSILAMNGDERWINPAIDYCEKYEGTFDVRRVKSVAMSGRDRLLNGEYQQILRATSRP